MNERWAASRQSWELGFNTTTLKDFDANLNVFRAPQRIPGHRPSSAKRHKPNPKALSHAHICTKHRGCEVKVLVLFDEAEEGQEIKWRNYQHQPGM